MQEFTGLVYLLIDIANNYGLDKKSWRERIQWTREHMDELESHLKEAEEPALFYASVKALRQAQNKEQVHYPISLDATASGIQILSCLLHDRKAASKCNVINTGNREDIYTNVYNIMCKKVGDKAKIEREMVKSAIMTSCYGSQAVPREIFGEGELYSKFLETMEEELPYVWEANKVFLEVWNDKVDSYHWILPDNFHANVKVTGKVKEIVNWLNEPIEITKEVQRPQKEGRSIGANLVHSIDGYIVREIARRSMYEPKKLSKVWSIVLHYYNRKNEAETLFDESNEDTQMLITLWNLYEQTGMLSARIIDYIYPTSVYYILKNNGYAAITNLLRTFSTEPFEVIFIHDCFRCLPNHGNQIRRLYIQLLYEISKSNLLEYCLRQITNNPNLTLNKLDDISNEILKSEYALS